MTEEEKVKFQKLLGQQILDVWYKSFADEEASPLEAIVQINFGSQWSLELLNPKFSLSILGDKLVEDEGWVDLTEALEGFVLQNFEFAGELLRITLQKDKNLEFGAPAWIIQQPQPSV